jgi:hypothetical protein
MGPAKTLRVPEKPLGFGGLCQAFSVSPKKADGFAYLCAALEKVDPSALSVLNPTTGDFLEHYQLCRDPCYKTTWDTSYANKLGRLCQGIISGPTPNSQRLAGTNTFCLINYNDIPLHKRKEICHTMVVCKVRPEKDNPDHTCITIGGNRICYPGNVGTTTALLKLVKLLLNSILFRKGARFSTIDIKNFYLDTPMPDLEYVCIKISDIPDKFLMEYNLGVCDRKGWIYLKFGRAVMGFPKLVSWPKIFFVPASSLKDSMKQPPCRVSGATNGIPSNSASSLMTLA